MTKRTRSLGTGLKAHHEKQLKESGIEYAAHLGLESTVEGLKFRYPNLETKKFETGFYRIRYDKVKGDQRYNQPSRSGVKLYFPPTFAFHPDAVLREHWWDALEDKEDKPRTVVIVEGEKKALALQQALGSRTIVVGLGGVWNWGRKAADGDRSLIDDFKLIKRWKDRDVYICFDSDVETNDQVEHAEHRLQEALRRELKVRARLISLPPDDDGLKVGVDDLIAGMGDGFSRLWRELCQDSVRGVRVKLPEPITGRTLVTTSWPKDGVILSDGEYSNLLVEGGTGFVHAGSGVGKTYFLLQLSAALSSGSDFLGYKAAAKKRVLFLQQELSEGWFARRVKRLRQVFGSCVDDILFINGDFKLASVDRFKTAKLHMERLRKLIQRHSPDLCVLDPLQGYYDLAEGSVDHSREFMKAVVDVSKRTGSCILMSHHDRKDATGSSMSQMRGGSPFSDLSDTVLGIKRLPKFERGENGKLVKCKDEFGEALYHPTDLVINFDKVRHNDGPLPDRLAITRMPTFEDGSYNPFFMRLEDPQGMLEYGEGDTDEF
jgi:hypothetical protein